MGDQTPAHQKAQENKRWVELSEDEQAPAHQKRSLDDQASDDAESEENYEAPEPPKPCRPARPQFAKPTREARARQFQAKLDECFGLDFDQVDPSQQDGLTHRMLCTLKSLGECVNLWQPDGTQVSEEGFRLLGLEESDMYALGRVIRKADKLLEERRFREAYDKLCTARQWFNPDTRMEQRAKAASHGKKNSVKREKAEKKDKKKACDLEACDLEADDDDWTQVKKKERKADDEVSKKERPDRASEQPRWKSDSKGSRKPEAVSKALSKPPSQASKPKLPLSHSKPQTSASKARKATEKTLCRYHVGIEQDRAFNVLRKLLGDRGSHMKTIAENSGAKLRIRGRGSGFLEGPNQSEASNEPLMICISAESWEGFEMAVKDVESLLERVHGQYRKHCHDRNLPVPRLAV